MWFCVTFPIFVHPIDPPSASEDSSENDEADEEADEPPQTETVEPPQIIRTTTPTAEQSHTACCAQPRDYGCPPNDIDEDFLNEIEDRPTFIYLQPRRGLVTQQTQIQFTEIQSLEESETTHLTLKMKGKMKYHPNP